MPINRAPHIGEYVTKTNAIWDLPQVPIEPRTSRIEARRSDDRDAVLLPVVFQHLIASRRNFRTILLQAGQNGEIALIDHRATKALDVAGARLLLVRRAAALLLGDGTGGNG
jgi:hypothetical protein